MAVVFFFNDTATTEIYTLSLHDALPISVRPVYAVGVQPGGVGELPADHLTVGLRVPDRQPHVLVEQEGVDTGEGRSEEHTSELQSRQYLVCRLLLEKKK